MKKKLDKNELYYLILNIYKTIYSNLKLMIFI